MMTKDDIEKLMNLREAKRALGLSYGLVIAHIREGNLRAYQLTGDVLSKDEITDQTFGLRFKPTDIEDFLNTKLVK